MAMNNGYQKIHGKFQSLMALALKLDQMPKQFGTGRDLSHTEIHLIEIIGDNKDLGVTDIARLIGVTKGAVSQTLKRLEKKGWPKSKRSGEPFKTAGFPDCTGEYGLLGPQALA